MRFPQDFLDEIKARLPVSIVVGRRVKLKKAGREWKGLSPFNAEKTPSFYVNDQKAAWFDHSAGKNGDVFTFLMESEGLSFPDAVERCASEAGVAMPARDENETRQEARRLSLMEVVDAAAVFFRDRLAAHKPARDYLSARGIGQETIDAFGLGFAPDDRSALKQHLRAAGASEADLIDAGLIVAESADVPISYDRFRNRAMFPIHDGKGRAIGFGGRDLSGSAPAKYLNTNETPIFDKGRTLYNAHRARDPAWNEKPVVVVEGYTATISSVAAGFPATVATMGTALTPAHMQNLWRLSDCPIIAYDGDAAGQRASRKAIDTALALMLPGRSLKIARMPAGMDPDDVVRQRGAAAYGAAIEGAVRLVDALWAAEASTRQLSIPDDRAALEAALMAAVEPIPDQRLRDQYRREYRDRIRSIPMRRNKPLRSNGTSLHSITPGNINLQAPPRRAGMTLRAAMLVLAVVRAPGAALAAADALSGDDRLSGEAGDVIRRALDVLSELPEATAEAMGAALEAAGVGASVAAARDLCHRAGIHSLDAGASEEAATALLTRH